MRTIVTLSYLGLAIALSVAAFGRPTDRSVNYASYENEHMPIQVRHKRCYPQDQCYRADRLHERFYRRDEGHRRPGTERPQGPNDGPSAGPGRPDVGERPVQPAPPVWRVPIVREHLQLL